VSIDERTSTDSVDKINDAGMLCGDVVGHVCCSGMALVSINKFKQLQARCMQFEVIVG
jgi:hypothetical protein